jgi:SAM-dependent methyltransferase
VREQGIHTVVDVGCGDWSFSRLIDWGDATYIGVDVVPELIASLQARYGNERRSFLAGDARLVPLPAGELLVMKDVLQHWPNQAIADFLPRLAGFRWAILTNDRDRYYRRGWRHLWRPDRPDVPNTDIPFGGYRPVRLREAPFHLDARELTRFRVRIGAEIRDQKEVLLWRNPAIE